MNVKNSLRQARIVGFFLAVFIAAPEFVVFGAEAVQSEDEVVNRIKTWAADLGGPDYTKRESAHESLKQLSEEELLLLARHYQQADDFETRIRIEEIAIQTFFIRKLPDVSAFLGVSTRVAINSRSNSRVQRGKTGLQIDYVVPQSSADVAGLKAGDLIVAIDGEPFLEGANFEALRYEMNRRRAGVLIRLDFYREYELKSARFPVGANTRRTNDMTGDPNETNEGIKAYQRAVKAFPIWWTTHFDPRTDMLNRNPSTRPWSGFQNPQSPADDHSPPEPKASDSDKRE